MFVTFAAMKMTIGQYAKHVGLERDTIHKRLKLGKRLDGVTKIEKVAGINILHVKESFLNGR